MGEHVDYLNLGKPFGPPVESTVRARTVEPGAVEKPPIYGPWAAELKRLGWYLAGLGLSESQQFSVLTAVVSEFLELPTVRSRTVDPIVRPGDMWRQLCKTCNRDYDVPAECKDASHCIRCGAVNGTEPITPRPGTVTLRCTCGDVLTLPALNMFCECPKCRRSWRYKDDAGRFYNADGSLVGEPLTNPIALKDFFDLTGDNLDLLSRGKADGPGAVDEPTAVREHRDPERPPGGGR